MAFHARSREWLRRNPSAVGGLSGGGAGRKATPDGAAWVALARTVLNLDEFITRE